MRSQTPAPPHAETLPSPELIQILPAPELIQILPVPQNSQTQILPAPPTQILPTPAQITLNSIGELLLCLLLSDFNEIEAELVNNLLTILINQLTPPPPQNLIQSSELSLMNSPRSAPGSPVYIPGEYFENPSPRTSPFVPRRYRENQTPRTSPLSSPGYVPREYREKSYPNKHSSPFSHLRSPTKLSREES